MAKQIRFTTPDIQTINQASIPQRSLIAQRLFEQGSRGAPVGHLTQGLNRLAQGLIGGQELGSIRQDERALAEQDRAAKAAAAENMMKAFAQRTEPGPEFQGPTQPIPQDLQSFSHADKQAFLGQSGTQFQLPESPPVQRPPSPQEIAQVLLGNPDNQGLGAQLMLAEAQKKPPAPVALGEGQKLVNPLTGQPVAFNPKPAPQPKAPTTREIPVAGGLKQTQQFNPATGKYENVGEPYDPNILSDEALSQKVGLKKAGKPETKIDVRTGENIDAFVKAEQSESGTLAARRFDELTEKAEVAFADNQAIEGLRRIPIDTGPGTNAKVALAEVASAVGFKNFDKFIGNAQQFRSITMQNLLKALAEQKGPQTEGDAERALKTLAGLGNTPEANRFILDVAQAKNNRTMQKANFIEKYRDLTGNLRGAEKAWRTAPENKSIFEDQDVFGNPDSQAIINRAGPLSNDRQRRLEEILK
jgi:hypothetical protein